MAGNAKNGKGAKASAAKGDKEQELPFYFRLPGLEPIGKFIYGLDFDLVTPGFLRFMIGSFLIGFLVSVIVSVSYSYAFMRNFHAPVLPAGDAGRIIDVYGGFGFYIKCSDAKSKYTVVLDAGMGQDSSEYDAVFAQLGSKMRVCVYDRAGAGYSQLYPQVSAHLSATGSRVASVMAKDLKYLLKAAGETGPFVLVGHGSSAVTAQYFAEKFGNVAGLVLLNPISAEALAANNFELKSYFESMWRGRYFWKWNFATIGIQAVLQDFGMPTYPSWYDKITPARQSLIRDISGRSEYWRALMEEAGLLSLSTKELAELRGSKPKTSNLPVRVVSSEKYCSCASETMNKAISAAANDVSKIYSSAVTTRVAGADDFPRTTPDVLVAQITEFVSTLSQ